MQFLPHRVTRTVPAPVRLTLRQDHCKLMTSSFHAMPQTCFPFLIHALPFLLLVHLALSLSLSLLSTHTHTHFRTLASLHVQNTDPRSPDILRELTLSTRASFALYPTTTFVGQKFRITIAIPPQSASRTLSSLVTFNGHPLSAEPIATQWAVYCKGEHLP